MLLNMERHNLIKEFILVYSVIQNLVQLGILIFSMYKQIRRPITNNKAEMAKLIDLKIVRYPYPRGLDRVYREDPMRSDYDFYVKKYNRKFSICRGRRIETHEK